MMMYGETFFFRLQSYAFLDRLTNDNAYQRIDDVYHNVMKTIKCYMKERKCYSGNSLFHWILLFLHLQNF